MDADYKIYIPSGNPTILVRGLREKKDKKQINDFLLEKYSFVEQVGFISEDRYRLEMAGGEFCGNATRCAIYYYLDGKDGNITIDVNGIMLDGGIKDGKVWVTMPVYKGNPADSVTFVAPYTIIRMDGITHVVIQQEIQHKDEQLAKDSAYAIMEELNLFCEPACGVMFIKYEDKGISLMPVVYVRDINTFFFETACGSGTTAVGIYNSVANNCDTDLDVMQPSGETIHVNIRYRNSIIENAVISGKVIEYG